MRDFLIIRENKCLTIFHRRFEGRYLTGDNFTSFSDPSLYGLREELAQKFWWRQRSQQRLFGAKIQIWPTCLASRRCSLVCGIIPSSAATNRMAPSICEAPEIRVGNIRIFIRIFFFEKYSIFEYFLTEYSNNTVLLNKPFKTVDFQAIVPKYVLKTHKKLQFSNLLTLLSPNLH
jgi:hypothetical protein